MTFGQAVEVVGLAGAVDEATFPLRTTVGGVDAVVIPVGTYRQLLAASARPSLEGPLKAVRGRRGDSVVPLASTIERDPEVAGFLRTRFARADTIEGAHQACLEQFGEERTPSKGRISSFRSKTRRGA